MPSHVVVVGAGPAGAALAFLLARRGVRVTLVERQTDFAREFRGEVLMPSGIDAFQQMGLGKAFEALPRARPQKADFHINGRFVQRFEFPDVLDVAPQMVSQPHMLEMLVEECAAFDGFRFVRGGTVAELLAEGSRTVGVRLRGEDREEIRGDLVVGADGRQSTVRRKAGLVAATSPEAFDLLWFKVPMPPWLPEEGGAVQAFIRPGQLCLAFPAFDGSLQMGWVILKGTFRDFKDRGTEAWLADLAVQTGPRLGEHLMKHRDHLQRPFVLDVVCYLLERWTAPGVLLLGDAAHPMSPVGGQGLNIALRDALVAANHLVPVLAEGADPAAVDAACAAVQEERYPEAQEVERLQRIPPRFFLRRSWWMGPVLEAVAFLLRRDFVRRRAIENGPPAITQAFLNGVTEVELRV